MKGKLMHEFKTLYEVTGDIKDINTLLVSRTDIKEIKKDGERLDFLGQNFFHRENVAWVSGNLIKDTNMWVFFAPSNVQGDIRVVLDAAKEKQQIPYES